LTGQRNVYIGPRSHYCIYRETVFRCQSGRVLYWRMKSNRIEVEHMNIWSDVRDVPGSVE
jgi:hypothetical protein